MLSKQKRVDIRTKFIKDILFGYDYTIEAHINGSVKFTVLNLIYDVNIEISVMHHHIFLSYGGIAYNILKGAKKPNGVEKYKMDMMRCRPKLTKILKWLRGISNNSMVIDFIKSGDMRRIVYWDLDIFVVRESFKKYDFMLSVSEISEYPNYTFFTYTYGENLFMIVKRSGMSEISFMVNGTKLCCVDSYNFVDLVVPQHIVREEKLKQLC